MKLLVTAAVVSLGITAAFIATFASRPALAPSAIRNWFGEVEPGSLAEQRDRKSALHRGSSEPASGAAKRPKLWSMIDASDLPTLVSRLRAAGFPPHVIRGVVGARVDEMFAPRFAAFRQQLDETPFWQPSLNSFMRNPKWMEEQQQIYRERSRLMRQILGDDFFAQSGDVTASQRRQYGDLSKPKIEQVQQINDDYAEMISQIRAGTQGIMLPEDHEKLTYLEREKRADLAKVMTPQELEDYEMRTATTTSRMRQAMTLMNATEEEYRALYRIRKPYDDEFYPSSFIGAIRTTDFEKRREREAVMNQQIKQTLGEARAAEYTRASNYEYQQLMQIAARDNLPPGAAAKAFDLRESIAAESWKIAEDRVMPADQKIAAMKALAEKARFELSGTLGSAGTAYAQSAQWLQSIAKGVAVKIDGTSMMMRSVAPTPPTRTAPAPAAR